MRALMLALFCLALLACDDEVGLYGLDGGTLDARGDGVDLDASSGGASGAGAGGQAGGSSDAATD
jgi:hypothetical protein